MTLISGRGIEGRTLNYNRRSNRSYQGQACDGISGGS